ncbi:GNAT family N-acetyltransferase [Sphingomonas sp. CJ99]
MTIAVRPAGAGDVAALDRLMRGSFPAAAEAELVMRLCLDGDMVLAMVAEDQSNGSLAGAVVFSRMHVELDGQPVAAVALAPLAVLPEYRRQGVGEALVSAGLEQLSRAGLGLCFVLGDPGYYARFGFKAETAAGFASPYAGDQFMAAVLTGRPMPPGERGVAAHAPAFAMLGEDA